MSLLTDDDEERREAVFENVVVLFVEGQRQEKDGDEDACSRGEGKEAFYGESGRRSSWRQHVHTKHEQILRHDERKEKQTIKIYPLSICCHSCHP